MVVWEPFEPWPQHNKPAFVPKEVPHEVITDVPDVVRVCINGRKNIQQVLDIDILRYDPSCFFKPGLTRIDMN